MRISYSHYAQKPLQIIIFMYNIDTKLNLCMKKYLVVGIFLFAFVTPVHASTVDVDTLLDAVLDRLLVLQAESATAEVPQEPAVAGIATSVNDSATVVASPKLMIVADGEVIHTSFHFNEAAAYNVCEGYAYDTDYMWQRIECVYAGDLIYTGTFVAG